MCRMAFEKLNVLLLSPPKILFSTLKPPGSGCPTTNYSYKRRKTVKTKTDIGRAPQSGTAIRDNSSRVSWISRSKMVLILAGLPMPTNRGVNFDGRPSNRCLMLLFT